MGNEENKWEDANVYEDVKMNNFFNIVISILKLNNFGLALYLTGIYVDIKIRIKSIFCCCNITLNCRV